MSVLRVLSDETGELVARVECRDQDEEQRTVYNAAKIRCHCEREHVPS